MEKIKSKIISLVKAYGSASFSQGAASGLVDTSSIKKRAESKLQEIEGLLDNIQKEVQEYNIEPVTRFEVIDDLGRRFTIHGTKVKLSFQDDNKTLKAFVGGKGGVFTEEELGGKSIDTPTLPSEAEVNYPDAVYDELRDILFGVANGSIQHSHAMKSIPRIFREVATPTESIVPQDKNDALAGICMHCKASPASLIDGMCYDCRYK